jgi:hypothetical protein
MQSSALAIFILAFCLCGSAWAGGYQHVTRPDGTGQILDAKGRVRASGKLVSGRVDGSWDFFESTGITLAKLQFSHGHLNGPIQLNFGSQVNPAAAGKTETNGAFLDDSPVGEWSAQDQTGRVFNTRVYEHGRIISARGIDDQGQPLSTEAAMARARQLEAADQQLVNTLLAFLR